MVSLVTGEVQGGEHK